MYLRCCLHHVYINKLNVIKLAYFKLHWSRIITFMGGCMRQLANTIILCEVITREATSGGLGQCLVI